MMSEKDLSYPPRDDDAPEAGFAHDAYAAGNPLEPPIHAVAPSEIDETPFIGARSDYRAADTTSSAEQEYNAHDYDADDAADLIGGEADVDRETDADSEAEGYPEALAYSGDSEPDDADDLLAQSDDNDGALAYAAWAETLETPSVDLDALLASVSSYAVELDDEKAPRARSSRAADAAPFMPTPYTPTLALPPLMTLRRGSLGSLVPAVCLIALGAWMTLTLTSGGALDVRLILAAAVGTIFISLLAHWIGSRRWARGGLLFALFILGAVTLVAISLQPGGLDLLRAYPLLLAVSGVALIGAGLLGRPRSSRALLPGVLLLAGAGAGVAYTLGLLPASAIAPLLPFWPVLVALVVLLFALPLAFSRPSTARASTRRRGRS